MNEQWQTIGINLWFLFEKLLLKFVKSSDGLLEDPHITGHNYVNSYCLWKKNLIRDTESALSYINW